MTTTHSFPPCTQIAHADAESETMILPANCRKVLIAVASRTEMQALCPGRTFAFWKHESITPRLDAVLTGLGKANAAGAVARALDPARHAGVLSIGVGGSLPGSGLMIASVVLASTSMFSDEGVRTPTGFIHAHDLGFPAAIDRDTIDPDPAWRSALESLGLPARPVATVSACSGTDTSAAELAARTGASVEAMEGAAVGLVAARLGLAFAEVRAVSNTTGDRDRQRWDLPAALAALATTFRQIAGQDADR